jgi:uncharacterized protein (DUF4415 family)
MTERKDALRSDLAKADARGVKPEDLEEIPEVTDDMFARAKPHIGGIPVKRGRPPSAERKEHINLRLPPDVLDHFRSAGPGWQTRISAVLRRHVERARSKPAKRTVKRRAKGG